MLLAIGLASYRSSGGKADRGRYGRRHPARAGGGVRRSARFSARRGRDRTYCRAAGWTATYYRRSQAARFSRSEEHTSELQSLMRISYAVFCLKKKKNNILIKQ